MKFPFFLALSAFLLVSPLSAACAQSSVPSLPAPIQALVDEGAQVRYLGRDHGLDGWITIKGGQEQYFYVMPDHSVFVMGILFDKNGKAVTIEQVRKLRGESGEILDSLTSAATPAPSVSDAFKFKSPSEQLYGDVEKSNWVPLGEAGAPVAYAFIDPQCPHCHAFVDSLRAGFLQNGLVQLRIIPVGFRDETKAQAAYLLATPNPGEKFMRHLDGDETALPAKSEINQQGVMRNMAIMQSWKFDVTPLIIYRAKDGTVKLVRGNPKDIESLVADLDSRT